MNRSLINCSLNHLPRSPRIRDDQKPHRIFSDAKIVENILKFLPLMSVNTVSKTFNEVASKLRSEREWLVLRDGKAVRNLSSP